MDIALVSVAHLACLAVPLVGTSPESLGVNMVDQTCHTVPFTRYGEGLREHVGCL